MHLNSSFTRTPQYVRKGLCPSCNGFQGVTTKEILGRTLDMLLQIYHNFVHTAFDVNHLPYTFFSVGMFIKSHFVDMLKKLTRSFQSQHFYLEEIKASCAFTRKIYSYIDLHHTLIHNQSLQSYSYTALKALDTFGNCQRPGVDFTKS